MTDTTAPASTSAAEDALLSYLSSWPSSRRAVSGSPGAHRDRRAAVLTDTLAQLEGR